MTLTMLAYEIALTRIFSVTMWYHFAFVAISLALFGMTAGALIVHFLPDWFTAEKVKRRMFQFSLVYAVAMAGALVGQLAVPFKMELNAVAIFSVVYTCALIAVPFTLVAAVVLLGLAVANNAKPFVKIVYGKEGEPAATPLHDEWNEFSRITVDGDPDAVNPPAVPGGLSPAADDRGFLTNQMGLQIDGTAGTAIYRYNGDESTEFLRYDVSNLHYYALEEREDFSSVVIGVGGGKDVLAALQFGSEDVTGIEINPEIKALVNDALGEFSGAIAEDARVDYQVDEARSWLERSDEQYDSIQISLIDSWAATGAGAYALTENSLYTVEAWDTFLDRLEPSEPGESAGILSATRFYFHQTEEPLEIIRTAVLASEVLDRRGVENPRDHILIYEGPGGPLGETLATVMVSPEPFDDGTLSVLGGEADDLGYKPILTPSEADLRFEEIAAPGGPGDALGQFDADVSAPTDDRPFFFQMVSFGDVLRGQGLGDDSHIFKGVYSLFFLGLGVLLLAAVCIGGPLVHIGRRTSHKGNLPHYLYFCGIGLGFLLVEVSQLMRLSTFLGHPTYALTVVLFTVLLFSGLGSLVVEKLVDLANPPSLLRPLVALLLVVLVFGQVTPLVIESQSGGTTPLRILVSVAILAPLAFAMGMPFAIGMRAATEQGAPTAFLWGINGATSVVASVLAMVIAVFWGISMTLLAGFAAYILATGSLFVTVRRLRSASAAGDGDYSDGASIEATVDAEEAEVQPAPAG